MAANILRKGFRRARRGRARKKYRKIWFRYALRAPSCEERPSRSAGAMYSMYTHRMTLTITHVTRPVSSLSFRLLPCTVHCTLGQRKIWMSCEHARKISFEREHFERKIDYSGRAVPEFAQDDKNEAQHDASHHSPLTRRSPARKPRIKVPTTKSLKLSSAVFLLRPVRPLSN